MKSAKCDPLGNSCYFYWFWMPKWLSALSSFGPKIVKKTTQTHEKTPSKKHQKKRRRKRKEKTENTSIWKAWHHEKPYKTNVKTTFLETWQIVKNLKKLEKPSKSDPKMDPKTMKKHQKWAPKIDAKKRSNNEDDTAQSGLCRRRQSTYKSTR